MLDVRSPGHVFGEWLDQDVTLTPTELRITQVLAVRFGEWVPAQAICRAVYRHQKQVIPADLASMRTHLYRIRPKIRPAWRIENRYQHGLYRLVAHE